MSDSILDKKNDFLYFDEVEDKIKVTPQASNLPVVKVLSNRDRSNGKKFMQKCVDFCYYMNHKNSPLAHLNKERKSSEVKKMESLTKFDENDLYYIAFEKLFIETHYSPIEHRYLKLMKEIDIINDNVVDVPTSLRKKFTKSYHIEELDKTVPIDVWINIDNSQAKYDSIKIITALDKLEGMAKTKVEQEYKKARKSTRRVFDQQNS